jgi:hypothetical protein
MAMERMYSIPVSNLNFIMMINRHMLYDKSCSLTSPYSLRILLP